MKILIILLLIVIAACLANSYLHESFINEVGIMYGNGEDYYPNQYVDNTCPSSCIQQACVAPYKS